jgi:hypothetical protein
MSMDDAACTTVAYIIFRWRVEICVATELILQKKGMEHMASGGSRGIGGRRFQWRRLRRLNRVAAANESAQEAEAQLRVAHEGPEGVFCKMSRAGG